MAAAKKLKIGVVVNRSKPGAMDVLNQLVEFAVGASRTSKLLFEKRTGALIKQPGIGRDRTGQAQSDLLLVAGGDGSLLDVVGAVYPTNDADPGREHRQPRLPHRRSERRSTRSCPAWPPTTCCYSKRLALETIVSPHRAARAT